jgi:hypothetical protein
MPAAATTPEVINFRRVISSLKRPPYGSAARDHGGNAFPESSQANHADMNNNKQDQ